MSYEVPLLLRCSTLCAVHCHDRAWVVVGLVPGCQDEDDRDCVSWVHGPFRTHDEAHTYAGKMPEGFRPHIMTLDPPMDV